MKTTIYCFSGTGNSLQAAKDIKDKIGDAEVIRIFEQNSGETVCASQSIGFVFPVYSFGLPNMMAKFIKKLKASHPSPYFFAFTTYRDKPGGAIMQLDNILRKKGYSLSAGFNIWMPGNYISIYEADDLALQNEKFDLYNKTIDEKIDIIKSNGTKIEKPGFKERFVQYSLLYPIMSASFGQMDRLFNADESCNGCSVCMNVCPAGNITMDGKKPVFHHKCEQCSACINWCPSGALQYTKKTIGRKRYHHPDIKLKEMAVSK